MNIVIGVGSSRGNPEYKPIRILNTEYLYVVGKAIKKKWY